MVGHAPSNRRRQLRHRAPGGPLDGAGAAAARLAAFPDATTAVMDAVEGLAVDADRFDVVASVFGASVFGDGAARAMGEMRRVTAPGGRVVVVHWTLPQGAPVFTMLFRVLAAEYGNPDLLTFGLGLLEADELAAAMNAVGIVDVRTRLVEVDAIMPEPDRAVRDVRAEGRTDADRASAHIAIGRMGLPAS